MCGCSGIKGEADEIPCGILQEVATHEQSPQVEMIRKSLPGWGNGICKGMVIGKNIRPLRNLENFILRFILRYSFFPALQGAASNGSISDRWLFSPCLSP